MKKILIAMVLCVIGTVMLTACGSAPEAGEPSENGDASASETEEALFHDNVYEDDDVKIVIKKTKVIQPGDNTYSEYNLEEKPVMAFWYDITNKSGEDIDPSQWIMIFTAIQDNDPNKVNELEVSGLPDDKYLDSQTETIKKGGTVESCVGYILDDEKTPVTLVVKDIITGDEKGSQDFKVK